MKKAILLICMIFSWNLVSAEVIVDDISLAETSALDNYDPTLELDQEMNGADDLQKPGTVIPSQPVVEVVAEPLDFINPDGSTDSVPLDNGWSQVDANSSKTSFVSEEFKNKKGEWYMTGLFGTTDYDTAGFSSDNAFGFSVGTRISNYFLVESALIVSKIFAEGYDNAGLQFYDKIDQYNVNLALKVPVFEGQIFAGRLQPIVGVVGSYTRRNYKEQSINGGYLGIEDRSTNAFDMGASLGVDFYVNKKFAIVTEYKYMFNITGGGETDFQSFTYATSRYDRYNRPITERADYPEDIGYHQISIGAKFKF